jgi:hypothetical protein
MSDMSLPTSNSGRRASAPTSQESYRRPTAMEAVASRSSQSRPSHSPVEALPRLSASPVEALSGHYSPVEALQGWREVFKTRSCGKSPLIFPAVHTYTHTLTHTSLRPAKLSPTPCPENYTSRQQTMSKVIVVTVTNLLSSDASCSARKVVQCQRWSPSLQRI